MNYYTELLNLHFLHLLFWIPHLSHNLQHFSQTKFTNFDLQFYLASLLPHHICLQLSNLLSYPVSILQQLMNFLHSHLVLLTLLVLLIQSLPHSSNNAHLFSPQSQISSTYLCLLESFLTNLKTVSVHPILKKSNLDKENLSNYRPITHLSKLTERRLVKTRFADHLNENNLLNSFQSAHTKINSTKTTLLALHDHIIRAMSQQQVSVFLIFLLPLTLLTIPFFYIASNLGLNSLKLSYPGFSLTYHLFLELLISMTSNLFPLNFSMVFLKVLFLVLFSSYSTQLRSVQ